MKKRRAQAGFTLAETLLAVMILLLVSLIVATGMPAVQSAYENLVLAADAESLLSTAVAALRDELGTARDVREEAIGSINYITYYSADIGARSGIYQAEFESGRETMYLQEYIDAEDLSALGIRVKQGTGRTLLTSATLTKNLYVKYDTVTVNTVDKIVTVSGLKVYHKAPSASGDKVLADLGKDDSGGENTLKIQVYSTMDPISATPAASPDEDDD